MTKKPDATEVLIRLDGYPDVAEGVSDRLGIAHVEVVDLMWPKFR